MWKKLISRLLTVAMTCTLISGKSVVAHADEGVQQNLNSYENVTSKLVPAAHNVEVKDGTLQMSNNVNFLGKDSADKEAVRILLEFLQANNIGINEVFDKGATTLALGEEGALESEIINLEEKINIPSISNLKEESYLLSITSEANDISQGGTIIIKGKDKDGTFYGVKTLIQLATSNNNLLSFNNVLITDEPSMSTRGIVEGFYGTPWNQSKRLDQIKFYGDYKMNTYIYAPKDDPYHREKWRDPYPESEMERMKSLINTSKENKVDFVFAISPGIDIRFDGQDGENDFKALIAKCESLYDMGVRSFAILYDDINNKEGNKQAQLLNRFNQEFIKAKNDVKPLITVPTEYDTRAMGVIGDLSSYTEGFSKTLNKDIKVMWTGQAVVSESLPLENVEFMRAVYGENIGVWWNYPVTDYLKSKLALGPIVDIDKRLEGKVDFFTMNPMEHANLSKISLATGADYSWNVTEYDSDRSWNNSIEKLFKELAPEMKTFANHSTRMNGAWGIGRNDAENIREIMNKLWLKLAKKQDATEEIEALNKEFDDMVKASDVLKAKLPQAILNECSQNLSKLKLLGLNGKVALNMVLAQVNNENDKYNQLKNEITKALSSLNSGSRVSEKTVLAFIKEAMEYNPLPIVSFKVSKTLVAPGEEVQFENTSSIVTEELEWIFEGAKVEKSTEQNPKVVYEKEGIYNVKLIGKNSLGQNEVIKENLITVTNLANNDRVNLALGKKATASSYVNANEAPKFAVDGSLRTKWCAVGYGKHTLNVDLGDINLVNQIVIKHAEEGGEPAGGNTLAYRVEISEDGTTFKELVKVTNNEQGITKDEVVATKGRYVRLIIDKPTQGDDSATRIYEFEVIGLKGNVELPPKYEKPVINKDELIELVTEAEDKEETKYTEESWTYFANKLIEAKEVMNNENATQEEVNEAIENLKDAISKLVVKVDKTELLEAVEEAKSINLEDYTVESVEPLKLLLEDAELLLNDKNASQEDINKLKEDILKAIDNLIAKEEVEKVDKTVLKMVIDYAEEVKINGALENVVPAVVNEFESALLEAKAILEDENSSEATVDLAIKRLVNVIHMLEFKKGDKVELIKLVEIIKTLDESQYIPSTWNLLKPELENANKVIVDENAMKEEVTTTYNKLIKAFLDLRLKPSKDKLQGLIKEAEKLDSSKYTKASWNVLEKELIAAKAVIENENATNKEIASSEKSVELAIKSLVKVGSDNNNNDNEEDNDNDNNNENNGNNNGSNNNNNGNNGGNNNNGNGNNNNSNSNGSDGNNNDNGNKNNNNKLPETGSEVGSLYSILGVILCLSGAILFFRKKSKACND